jgi:tellurite resistance protein TehA-like permease
MLVLGADAPSIMAAHGRAAIGIVAKGVGIVAGLLLWGFGLWWLALAVLITWRYSRAGIPFNLGWWGYIFPLAVFTLATIWIVVAAKTLAGAWKGELFVSPCIAPPG